MKEQPQHFSGFSQRNLKGSLSKFRLGRRRWIRRAGRGTSLIMLLVALGVLALSAYAGTGDPSPSQYEMTRYDIVALSLFVLALIVRVVSGFIGYGMDPASAD